MDKKDRYYIGRIEECFGDYETGDTFVFKVPAGARVATVARKIAEDYRGAGEVASKAKLKEMAEVGKYYFDCYVHSGVDYNEIPKEEFDILAKHLAYI